MFCNTAIKSSKLFVAFIIVIASSCSASKKSGEKAIPLEKPIAGTKTMLWQVSGNDLKNPSFLFGTIHVISSDDYHVGENVMNKLVRSKQLVLEMDLNNINPQEVADISLLPDNKTIKDYVKGDDYLLVESFFADSLGAPVALFKTAYARLKPFFLQQMIYLKYLGENTSSYENEFMQVAKDNNIQILGLETLKEQIDLIDQMSIEDQYTELLRSIREEYKEEGYLDTLIQTYKNGDVEKLHQMIVENEDFRDINNTMVDERNRKWIPKLEDIFEKSSTFVAVGAGHLGGPSGLIQLLREAGYQVDPIKAD